MDCPNLIRGLRIAWSVCWGILCVLLVVLWVRSYNQGNYLYWNIVHHRSVIIGSTNGRLLLHTQLFEIGPNNPHRLRQISRDSFYMAIRWIGIGESPIRLISSGFQLDFPFWLLVLTSGSCA